MHFRIAVIAMAALAMVFARGPAQAQSADDYPQRCKVINYIVPFGAGGGTDRWARILSSVAIDEFGVPWHVKNMPGASAVVGWRHALGQPADGCTILQGSPTPVLALLSEAKPPIQPDQIKIAAYVSAFRAIVVAAKGKEWSTWEGLVKYAKANPGKLTLGGSLSNSVGAANVMNEAGLKVTYVPYPETAKAIADFLGGHITLAAATTSTIQTIVPEKATAVINTSDIPLDEKTRKQFGNIPSATSLGMSGISFPRWVGVHPDTPDAIAEKVSVGVGKILKSKSVKRLLRKIGEEIIYSPRAEATGKYERMVKAMRKNVKLVK